MYRHACFYYKESICMFENLKWAGETVQWVKHLPQNYEVIPGTYRKDRPRSCLLGSRDGNRIPGACWSASLAELVPSKFTERPSLKNEREVIEEDSPCQLCPSTHTHTTSHTHTTPANIPPPRIWLFEALMSSVWAWVWLEGKKSASTTMSLSAREKIHRDFWPHSTRKCPTA